jgi:general stress protein 26
MTKKKLYNFIRQHKHAVLSTVSQNNIPESALVGFIVTPNLKLFFDTVSDSRKYKNLLLNSHISFVIGWEDGQTLQYEGVAKIPNHRELEDLLNTYFEVFPDGKDRIKNWKNISYFCVEPKWIRYSDFKKSIPRIKEFKY